jgi:hypothetical protein
MIIDRRTFIQCATVAATTQALAALLPLSSHAQNAPAPGASHLAAELRDANSIVFKIDGWDCSDAETSADNEVLIRINHSWRAAWR